MPGYRWYHDISAGGTKLRCEKVRQYQFCQNKLLTVKFSFERIEISAINWHILAFLGFIQIDTGKLLIKLFEKTLHITLHI